MLEFLIFTILHVSSLWSHSCYSVRLLLWSIHFNSFNPPILASPRTMHMFDNGTHTAANRGFFFVNTSWQRWILPYKILDTQTRCHPHSSQLVCQHHCIHSYILVSQTECISSQWKFFLIRIDFFLFGVFVHKRKCIRVYVPFRCASPYPLPESSKAKFSFFF